MRHSPLDRRVVPFEGGRNFRDLGGYATEDGRRVSWGKVFRSGTLAHLTSADISLLRSMEVRTICDLRAERERQEEPHPELPGANHHFWNYDAPASSNAAISTEITPGEMRDRLIGFYRQLPWTFAPQFREVFVQVAAGRLPLVINCVAGKDRTGIACALLLGALGVPRPTVIEDYVLSERCVDYEQVMVQPALANGRNNAAGFGLGNLSVEQRAPVLRSDPDYITNALDAIDARHGSLNAYLDSALGVGEAMLADIRTHLLEETESEE